ncbi:hypothetical protein ACWIGI_15910 [Nocardia sp. NPDC055321]
MVAVLALTLGAISPASALPLAPAAAMYVTAENPSAEQLGTQIAAISNPNNSDDDRRANVVGANGQYRPLYDLYFQYIRTVKTGDVTYELGEVQRNGDVITLRINSSTKGYGSFDENHYWLREDGRWKYDVVRWCKESVACPGKNLL